MSGQETISGLLVARNWTETICRRTHAGHVTLATATLCGYLPRKHRDMPGRGESVCRSVRLGLPVAITQNRAHSSPGLDRRVATPGRMLPRPRFCLAPAHRRRGRILSSDRCQTLPAPIIPRVDVAVVTIPSI